MEINNNDANLACSQAPRRKDRKRQTLQNGTSSRRHNAQLQFVCYFLPVTAAVLCYLNGLKGDFVHDDKYAIEYNPDVTGLTHLTQVFQNDFWGKPMGDNTSHKSYRPLCVLTFRSDYYLGGGDPWLFHAVNVLLHALVTCLFVHVLRSVCHVRDLVSGASALLFAVHPVHTEAVTGIVGRADILSGLGILLSLYFYARSLGVDRLSQENGNQVLPAPVWRRASFWLSMVASGAAMLCKEHGVTSLGICLVLDLLFFSGSATVRWLGTRKMDIHSKALVQRISIVMCVTAVLLGFRLWMMCGQMPSFRDEDNPASFSDSFLTRVLTFNYLIAVNVWLLLCPRVLSYDWQQGSIPLVEDPSDVRNLATVTVYVILVLMTWKCLRGLTAQDFEVGRGDHNNNENNGRKETVASTPHIVLLSLVLMALPFLPSSNLFFRVGFVVAERVLYVPSLGFCLLVGYSAVTLWQRYSHRKHNNCGRLAVFGAYFVLTLLLASKTWTRNYVWRTRETLFRSGVETFPHNAKAHYNYANFLKDSGHFAQAAEHYKTAISLYPTQPSYHNNLGNVLTDPGEAEACFREALRLYPSHRGALVNLGNLLLQKNDTKGEQLLHRALELDPHYTDALLSLGQLAIRRGAWRTAEGYLRAALAERPDLPDAHNLFGVLHHQAGNYEEALASYKRAVSLNKHHAQALTNAAASLRQLGRTSEAEDFLKRAVSTSVSTDALEQLGQLYLHAGRTRDAVTVYTQMAQRAPNDTSIIINYVNVLLESGEARQAESVLGPLLARSPHNRDLLFAASYVQRGLGNVHEAISLLKEAARWAGNDASMMAKIHYELGNLYKDLKQFALALQSYQESVEWDPALYSAHHNLGALYHLMEDYSRARHHYEHALRIQPDSPTVRENLAKLHRALTQRNGLSNN